MTYTAISPSGDKFYFQADSSRTGDEGTAFYTHQGPPSGGNGVVTKTMVALVGSGWTWFAGIV